MPAAVQDLQRVDFSPPRAPMGPPVHPLPPQALPRGQQPQKESSSHQVVISGQQVLGAATSIISKAATAGSRAVSTVKSNVKSTLHTRVGGSCDAKGSLRLPLHQSVQCCFLTLLVCCPTSMVRRPVSSMKSELHMRPGGNASGCLMHGNLTFQPSKLFLCAKFYDQGRQVVRASS